MCEKRVFFKGMSCTEKLCIAHDCSCPGQFTGLCAFNGDERVLNLKERDFNYNKGINVRVNRLGH